MTIEDRFVNFQKVDKSVFNLKQYFAIKYLITLNVKSFDNDIGHYLILDSRKT